MATLSAGKDLAWKQDLLFYRRMPYLSQLSHGSGLLQAPHSNRAICREAHSNWHNRYIVILIISTFTKNNWTASFGSQKKNHQPVLMVPGRNMKKPCLRVYVFFVVFVSRSLGIFGGSISESIFHLSRLRPGILRWTVRSATEPEPNEKNLLDETKHCVSINLSWTYISN